MPVEKQEVAVKVGSLDTLTDIRQLSLGALSLLENMVRKKGGALQKRNGAVALTALGAAATRRLATINDELLTFTTDTVGTITVQSLAPTRALWNTRAQYVSCIPSIESVYASANAQTFPDSAINGSYCLIAWEDSVATLTVRYRVMDLATNAVLLEGTIVNAVKPKCVSSGTNLLVFYADESVTSLKVKRISVSGAGALSVASTTTVAANLAGIGGGVGTDGNAYDVQARADVARVAICYASTIPDVRLVDWNPTTDTATTSTTVAGQQTRRCCGWALQNWNTTNVYVFIADSVNGVKTVEVTRATFALSAVSVNDAASTNAAVITGDYSTGVGVPTAIWEVIHIGTTPSSTISCQAGAGITTQNAGIGICSKLFLSPGGQRLYIARRLSQTGQNAYFVMRLGFTDPVAHFLFGVGEPTAGTVTGSIARRGNIYSVASYNGMMVAVVLRAIRIDTIDGLRFSIQTNPVLLSLDFGAAANPIPKELGGTLFVPGGELRSYDIRPDASNIMQMPEAIAPHAPEPPAVTAAAAGALTPSATYKWKLVYSTVDERGRLRRSAPSDFINGTTIGQVTLSAAQNSASLTYRTVTATGIAYTIEIYRTLANGGTFFREGIDDGSGTFNSTISDALLAANEPLYTDSGELPNYPPPAFTAIESHRARLWGISAEDTREVWYSKEIQTGLGIGFHPDFKLRLEGNDGGAYALASMDDKLLAFKKNSIYVTTGDGPDNTGAGSTFPPFTLVSRNVGTIEPQSVMLTPDGVMFKSQKGIWILTRSLEVQYMGSGVDAYNSLTSTAAVLVETDRSEARICTSAGRTLVYDYSWKEWFTFTGQAAVSAVSWQGKFTYVLTDGTVLQESAAAYADNGAAITQALEIPIAVAAAGGAERIFEARLEGDYFTASTLTIKVAYDYETTNQETLTKALGGIQVDNTYRCRVKFARRNCEAARLRIEESSTAQGFALGALALVVGVTPGKGGRLPAANVAT